MALPERRDAARPQLHVDDLGDQRSVERVTSSGWRWWFVIPLFIAVAVWWAGWGWAGTGGWWWGRSAKSARIAASAGASTTETLTNAGAAQAAPHADTGGPQPMSGPGVKILDAANKKAFVGQQFAANDIPVRQELSTRVLWIGEKYPILAVVTGKGTANGILPGRLVDALGTVKKAPPEAHAKHEWDLSDQDASRLEKQGAYLQVSQLSLPPQ